MPARPTPRGQDAGNWSAFQSPSGAPLPQASSPSPFSFLFYLSCRRCLCQTILHADDAFTPQRMCTDAWLRAHMHTRTCGIHAHARGMRVRGLAGQHTIAHLRTRAHGCQASARKHSYKPRHKINESAFVAPFFASLPPGFCLGATDASCVSNFFASASLSKQAPAIFAQRCGTHSSVEVRNVCHTDPRRHPRLQWSR